jgi:hypothetical protein
VLIVTHRIGFDAPEGEWGVVRGPCQKQVVPSRRLWWLGARSHLPRLGVRLGQHRGTATSTGHEGILDTGSKTLFLLARSGVINSAAHAEAMLPQKHHGVHLSVCGNRSFSRRSSVPHPSSHAFPLSRKLWLPDWTCISSDMPDTACDLL